jgi:hypothetical protein
MPAIYPPISPISKKKISNRDPLSTDNNYNLLDEWLNTTTDDAFVLTDLTLGVANWEQIDGAGGDGEDNIGNNVVNAGEGIYVGKSGETLEFKNISTNSSDIDITTDENNNILIDMPDIDGGSFV